ncbi:hypothetical protein GH733_011357 [Mirounga leonina]|nr:hypothetical protein GH733_011357 [Mirounga leonina]
MPLLLLETQLMSASCHPGILASLLLLLEPLPLLAASLLEPSLPRTRQPSESRDFWWLLIPGLTTSLSQGLSSVLCGHCHPLQQQGSSLNGSDIDAGLRSSLVPGTISHEHPWEVMPELYFYRDPEEIEKEEQPTAENVVTKEEFQDEWTTPAPEFTAT